MISHNRVSACAPGRVELLGNHTDYNEGVVLGAAIDRFIFVSGIKNDRFIRITSADFGEVEVRPAKLRPLQRRRWANYILGVADELRNLDVPIGGFTADVSGDLPIGVGLSSSAAFELATALFLLKLFPARLEPLQIAKACQRAEHRFVGVQSGLLDQVISLFGRADHAVFFDSRSEEIRCVPFPAQLALMIAESGKKRELATANTICEEKKRMPLLGHSAPARCAMLVRQTWIVAAICQRCCAAVLRMSSAKTSASGVQ
jgi:galactokinase